MEEQATQDSDVVKAREAFRVDMARMLKATQDLNDPAKAAALADLPPHAIGH